jgi:gluconate 2-dehydrogenase gamma chain
MSESMDRRSFLKSAAGGTMVLVSAPALAFSQGTPSAHGCKIFTVAQATLVEAIAEQIVPADEYPGGKDAGVVFYIDGILAGPFGRSYRERYEQGLRLVDELSQRLFHGDFVSLDNEQQVAVLKTMESGDDTPNQAREFFSLILQHTMEGYYGDPEHGGNRDNASWKMIGFEG